MAFDFKNLEERLRTRFGAAITNWVVFRGQHCVHVSRERIVEVLTALRDDEAGKFDFFCDITAVDNLKLPERQAEACEERFTMVYQMTSLEPHAARIRVKAFVPEEPCKIDSACGVFRGANWGEREVFDMYGIEFVGHPDLRKILTPEYLEGFPLRKDYPLKGRGERDNFPKYTDFMGANA